MNSPPFVAGSETSKAAAESMRQPSGHYRLLVLRALRMAPEGLTDEEIQRQTGMNPSTERPRRIELVTAEFVRDSGRTRLTSSGRAATVWVAAP